MPRFREPSITDDVIDSRDLIEALKDYRDQLEDLEERLEDLPEDAEEENEDLMGEIELLNDEYAWMVEIEGNLEDESEWNAGLFLIADHHFTDYMEEYFCEIGDVDPDSFLHQFIDWDSVAEAMKPDYDEIEAEGQSFYYRAY